MTDTKCKIVSFHDLEVYRLTYDASLKVMTEIVPYLPKREQYDLADQLSRSCKAIPRLIAEGYAKRHQKQGFRKYLDDAMAECNETLVGVCHCQDLYNKCFKNGICEELIKIYDRAGRQLYRLAEAWGRFGKPNNLTQQPNRLPYPYPNPNNGGNP